MQWIGMSQDFLNKGVVHGEVRKKFKGKTTLPYGKEKMGVEIIYKYNPCSLWSIKNRL